MEKRPDRFKARQARQNDLRTSATTDGVSHVCEDLRFKEEENQAVVNNFNYPPVVPVGRINTIRKKMEERSLTSPL
jgi:hypothetical protein